MPMVSNRTTTLKVMSTHHLFHLAHSNTSTRPSTNCTKCLKLLCNASGNGRIIIVNERPIRYVGFFDAEGDPTNLSRSLPKKGFQWVSASLSYTSSNVRARRETEDLQLHIETHRRAELDLSVEAGHGSTGRTIK